MSPLNQYLNYPNIMMKISGISFMDIWIKKQKKEFSQFIKPCYDFILQSFQKTSFFKYDLMVTLSNFENILASCLKSNPL